ncbi:MAG: hypothetical protein EAZ30_03570 [Betaproteobacteria bacterium]|nr:MAG: hypothetical protein EAZ30_03570 [Betaproteobacteria bacterium]
MIAIRGAFEPGRCFLRAASVAISLAFTLSATSFCAVSASAAPLRLVIHEDIGAEGEAQPPISRYNPLKRSIEAVIGRPVDVLYTRERPRLLDIVERNQADVVITHASDIAAKALTGFGYTFIATARPEASPIFVGKSAPVENLTALKGKTIAMPRQELMFGLACSAEMRDFVGTQFSTYASREYAAVVWAVENNVHTVGCLPSNARAAEGLEKKGLKIIYAGRPQPTLPVVASPSLPGADRAAIAKLLSNMDEADPALKVLGVTSFTEAGEARMRALAGWLRAK